MRTLVKVRCLNPEIIETKAKRSINKDFEITRILCCVLLSDNIQTSPIAGAPWGPGTLGTTTGKINVANATNIDGLAGILNSTLQSRFYYIFPGMMAKEVNLVSLPKFRPNRVK